MEGWPVLTSAYVTTQIFTTIGYGNFHARSTKSKIFMSVFAVVMLVVAANIMGFLADRFLRKQSEAIKKYLQRLDDSSDEISGDVYKLIMSSALCVSFIVFGTVMFFNLENCTCDVEGLIGCRDPDYATCVTSGGYVNEMSDAFFMSVMSLTTIGFGDYQPRTVNGRLIAIPWMFIGVAVLANYVHTLGTFFYERKKATMLMAADGAAVKSEAAFKSIDRDGKGHLDRTEFLAYTLLKYDVISEDLVEAIYKEYAQLEGANPEAGLVSHAMIFPRAQRQQSYRATQTQKDVPVV